MASYTGTVVGREGQRSTAVNTSRVPRSGYLPSLDGWRALAILAVLMDHDDPWSFHGHSNAAFHAYGGWGVYLFFAISGLLVCTRILEDESLLGHFRLRAFYIRRFFRIQPAAIVYVATIALLTWSGFVRQRGSSLLGALFLYQNYLFNPNDMSGSWFLTGHFWTLAVEEHFYLLLSALLFFVKRWRLRVFAGLLVLLYLWQRAAIHFDLYATDPSRNTELNLPFLLTPALFALLLRRKTFRDAILRYLHPWVAFVGSVVAIQLWGYLHLHGSSAGRHPSFTWFLLSPALLFYAFEFWVVSTMLHPRSWTTRVLELKPLRFVGRLSYSLYLWHALFFVGGVPAVGLKGRWLLLLTERPWRYVATLVLSLASYYLIERRLIRLGHRLAPPATPGHVDLGAQTPGAIVHTAL